LVASSEKDARKRGNMATTVVGIDDSQGARAALAWVAHHAGTTGDRLRVVHAYEFSVAWIDAYAPELPQWRQHAQRAAEEMTERVVSDVLESDQREGIDVEVVEGSPVEVLHDEAVMLGS
jgi:nucleotide-binding universal stress UspA family protein